MKYLNFILLVFLISSVAQSSCKKSNIDSNDTTVVSTSPLLGKWFITEIVNTSYVNGVSQGETIVSYNQGEFLDFYDSTHLAIYIYQEYDTMNYTILNDSQIVMDYDTVNIVTSSSNQLDIIFADKYEFSGVIYEDISEVRTTK